MDKIYIGIYTIEVEAPGNPKAGDNVDVHIKMAKDGHYVMGYRLMWFADDNAASIARRAMAHFYMGDCKIMQIVKESSDQIRAKIEVNKKTWEQASGTLREILDEPEPRQPYYLERLISALNLCTDVAKHRAQLEEGLQRAIQMGK